eukprot:NODE_7133_length_417_cov_4.138587_g5501_i0.p3 GENE.NODE_7133_length_417_cov_4.138587_g5501_i0~~NODE_7133_length_417_cov_4.138587_g5501_i0.p3  ORF type:complete len:68 (-),score=13.59 NODE_7133_length_417_cov_4.138587_g5501_i0:93-296(-)
MNFTNNPNVSVATMNLLAGPMHLLVDAIVACVGVGVGVGVGVDHRGAVPVPVPVPVPVRGVCVCKVG